MSARRRTVSRHAIRFVAAAILASLLPLPAVAGEGNLLVVTTTADAVDDLDGLCSLREALRNANTNTASSPVENECPAGSGSVTDVIVLATGVEYGLTRVGAGDDAGDLDILDDPALPPGIVDVEIRGNDGDGLSLLSQKVAAQRVLEIHGAEATLVLVGLRDGEAQDGGGIFNDGGSLRMVGAVVLFNTAVSGAGIFSSGPVVFEGGGAAYNEATAVGGGIAQVGASLTAQDALFVENSAVAGGGVHAVGTDIVLVQSSFYINTAQTEGAGIRASDVTTLDVSGGVFVDNAAGGNGGAMHLQTLDDVTLRDAQFLGNSALNGGAVFLSGTDYIDLEGGLFGDNTAVADGGAIHAGRVRATGTRFVANSAGSKGGAVADSVSFLGIDVLIAANEAAVGGGLQVQQIYLERARVENNAASDDGGGIVALTRIVIDDSRITGNTAGDDGAGIWFGPDNATDARVLRSLLAGNVAQGDGGGIWLGVGNTLAIANSTLSQNRAKFGDGSGVYIQAGATVVATNATFADNLPGENIAKFGVLQMRNSIISTPGGTGCVASLDDPTIVSLGNNLSSDASCFGLDAVTDMTDVDVLLAPLAYTSGTTLTHALLPGSPAIDRGDAAACAAIPIDGVDQRGGARNVGLSCDIGAHEQGAAVSMTLFGDGFESD